MKLLSDEKGWLNNLGGMVLKGLAGLVASGGCPTTGGEGGLSTIMTPTVEGFVSGELEGGELRRPFFFFFGTGLNGMSGKLPLAVSMSI